ncbi:MAG: PASTA domain-containing protein [Erysipelotrichaceae bacterium]|nr:PASTA domain-containing protein [Erysipelotrichaceae bacterium]
MINKRINIVLGIIFVILLAVAIFTRTGSSKIKVEDFTGKTYQDVINWAETNSVPDKSVVFNYVYSDTIPENNVISQNIRSGSFIASRNSLVLNISKGINPDKRITLMDFTGMNSEMIEAWLTENNFTNYRISSEINENAEENLFLYSEPAAGTRIRKDDEVNIVICEHDHSTTTSFPDFTGLTITEIQEWADTNNIQVNYIYYTDAAAEGSFLFSDLPVGSEIDKGSTISVAVSSGPGY